MKTIHHVVDVDAPSRELFAAITTQDGLAGWWTTKVDAPTAETGALINFTFAGDFNPTMEIVRVDQPVLVEWKCVSGHDPWLDNTFKFDIGALDGGNRRLRFWQHYATELEDDDYGIYNYNWGYYLQSLYELVTTGEGKPFKV